MLYGAAIRLELTLAHHQRLLLAIRVFCCCQAWQLLDFRYTLKRPKKEAIIKVIRATHTKRDKMADIASDPTASRCQLNATLSASVHDGAFNFNCLVITPDWFLTVVVFHAHQLHSFWVSTGSGATNMTRSAIFLSFVFVYRQISAAERSSSNVSSSRHFSLLKYSPD